MILVLGAVTAVAIVVQSPRWFRVAQREHYHPTVSRFAFRWWASTPANIGLGSLAILGAAAAVFEPMSVLVAATAVMVGPLGLALKGRTSGLAWTPRMRASAASSYGISALLIVVGVAIGSPGLLVLTLVGFPVIVDAALAAWRPVQARMDRRWVEQAKSGLERSGARIVAITGSFGKTTTKAHLAHLLAGSTAVVASPASFNNRMGLARAVNEHLSSGTEVFIAEMGTYGPGEIADLCTWIPPDVALLTALGPVHLERMGTLEAIAAAKREIFERARVGVISIDHAILQGIAEEERRVRQMITVSATGLPADVVGDPESGTISVDGDVVGAVDPEGVAVSNAACAVAAVIALGFGVDDLADRLATLPTPPHRQVISTSDRGVIIIDDTFNSNPTGAARALGLLEKASEGRRVLVTPGMVELGPVQDRENEDFARRAAEVADDVVIVGHTNRRALGRGARSGRNVSIHFVSTRDEAVAWVRSELETGDAVLYENDLPDHYP